MAERRRMLARKCRRPVMRRRRRRRRWRCGGGSRRCSGRSRVVGATVIIMMGALPAKIAVESLAVCVAPAGTWPAASIASAPCQFRHSLSQLL